MSKLIFVNLPVTDLGRSVAFYEALGASRNPLFSDGSTACMVLSDTIHVMLLEQDRFLHFSPKPIADRSTAQVLLCISAASRAEVDATVEKAGAAGGVTDPNAADDHGFMYGRSLEDPDGHLWQIMWMDMEAAKVALSSQSQPAG